MLDPTSDSAPLHVLMSLAGNPGLEHKSDEELAELIKTFRGIASPVAMAAKIKSEKAKPRETKIAKLQSQFDLL